MMIIYGANTSDPIRCFEGVCLFFGHPAQQRALVTNKTNTNLKICSINFSVYLPPPF